MMITTMMLMMMTLVLMMMTTLMLMIRMEVPSPTCKVASERVKIVWDCSANPMRVAWCFRLSFILDCWQPSGWCKWQVEPRVKEVEDMR